MTMIDKQMLLRAADGFRAAISPAKTKLGALRKTMRKFPELDAVWDIIIRQDAVPIYATMFGISQEQARRIIDAVPFDLDGDDTVRMATAKLVLAASPAMDKDQAIKIVKRARLETLQEKLKCNGTGG